MVRALPLPLEVKALAPIPTRLLVAGPRESKWPGARVETAALLRRVAMALAEIPRSPMRLKPPGRDRMD